MRQVFIYWKVPVSRAEAATAAMRSCQASLRLAHAGLRTGLFRRSDTSEADDRVTLMETYATATGIDDALQSFLVARGDAALQPFGAPRRHVELFDELPEGADGFSAATVAASGAAVPPR